MEQAKRYNEGKPRWSLVDFRSLEPMVRVLEFGADKYGDYNWQKGLPFREACESMMRHIIAYMGGETTDQESGISHLGHIMSNAMFLSYYEYHLDLKIKFDDRADKLAVVRMEDSSMTDEIVEALKCGAECKGYDNVHQMMHELNQKRSTYSNCPHVVIDSDEDIPDTTDGLKPCKMN